MKALFSVLIISVFLTRSFTSCTKESPPEIIRDTLTIRDTIIVKDTVTHTLYLRPGPNDGRDVIVAYRENDGDAYANFNHIHNSDLSATRWTFNSENAGEGTYRSFVKFSALYGLPDNAIIESAKLSLFGVSVGTAAPEGNSTYPGSPYSSFGSNKCWIKRVVENWNERTITWNNKPSTTDENQVEVPQSTARFNSDAENIDVTKLVQDMLNDSKKTAGFCLQLQNEEIYRSINFASSRYADSVRRPKLVVVYKTIE